MKNIKSVFLSLSILFTFSCQPNSPSIKEELKGDWIIIEALRNNKPTLTLKDAFFSFTQDSGMITNILGDSTRYEYEIENKILTQLSPEAIIYSIERLGADTLHLKSKIRNYDFDFIAVRDAN